MSHSHVKGFLYPGLLCVMGCGPGLELNKTEMTPAQMAERSTHAFVGVIQSHRYDGWPFFRVPGDDSGYWKVLRRRVLVKAVLKGREPRKQADIYEISWTGGATGDWNFTQDGARYLFLVRVENSRYHVVRDWWRSIYRVNSGTHSRLPLNDSKPFWERVALMMWWVQPDHSPGFGGLTHTDPGGVLGSWRTIKILRGLLRHPEPGVRLAACETLLHWGIAQDECWDDVPDDDRKLLNRIHNVVPPLDAWKRNRRFEERAFQYFRQGLQRYKEWPPEMDNLRLLTTIRDDSLRSRLCALYRQEFPSDTDHGCPADRLRPATIVTQDGDLPLTGEWPHDPNA